MAWMALFMICTVAPEQNGWRPTFPAPGTPAAAVTPGSNPQPSPGTPTPAGGVVGSPSGPTETATSSYWTQLQDTLAAPVRRSPAAGPNGTTGSANPAQMRQATGVQFPPAPPESSYADGSSFTASGQPNTAPQNEVLPPEYGQSSDPRAAGSHVLYEGDARGDFPQRPVGFRGKSYVTPPQFDGPPPDSTLGNPATPPVGDGSRADSIASRPDLHNPGLSLPPLAPPGNTAAGEGSDQRRQAQRVTTQPPPSAGQTSDASADQTSSAPHPQGASSSTASDRWWPLLLALLGLFGSLGFNLYLGWIAWDLHGRYQDVVADLHDLENQFDERPGELDPERSGRRESRRMAALAG